MKKIIIKNAGKLMKIREGLVRTKIRLQRTTTYLAIFNSGMIFFLFLSKLQDYGINIHITKWFFPLYILTMISLFVFGWLDDKVGLYREEMKQSQDKNPYMSEMQRRFDSLEKKMDSLNKDISRLKKQ